MNRDVYKVVQSELLTLAGFVDLLPLKEFVEAQENAETMGPILDPTLYRDALYSGKWDCIRSISRAALTFQKAIREAKTKLPVEALEEVRDAD